MTNLEAGEGFAYSYDSAFRITGITDADHSAFSQSYGYDALDRLTSATGASLNETWTYDANGNRQTQGGAAASTYNLAPASNRLSSISGGLTRTYTYAPSGQTTGYGGLTFTYMDSGRLSSVSNGSATTTYVLNALGQRVKKSGTSVTLFVYDESGHLLGEYDGSGNLIEETVWMGYVPVATLRPNGTGISVYYIHTDHLNTPRRISRSSDNVIVWRWDSEPFGTAAANQDPDGDGIAFVYNMRMPGQYFDAETGLNYNYQRDYDPGTGRYLESDPIGLEGGINTYAYVGGNPLSYSDPTGLAPPGRAQPGYGVPSLFPPGPFDESWNKSRDAAALALEEWINRAVNTVQKTLGDTPAVTDPMQTAKGNVADTQIVKDYGEAASAARLCGKEAPDRCDWLKQNASKYRRDQV